MYTPRTQDTDKIHLHFNRPRSDSESRRKSANSDKNSAGKRQSDKRLPEGQKKIGA